MCYNFAIIPSICTNILNLKRCKNEQINLEISTDAVQRLFTRKIGFDTAVNELSKMIPFSHLQDLKYKYDLSRSLTACLVQLLLSLLRLPPVPCPRKTSKRTAREAIPELTPLTHFLSDSYGFQTKYAHATPYDFFSSPRLSRSTIDTSSSTACKTSLSKSRPIVFHGNTRAFFVLEVLLMENKIHVRNSMTTWKLSMPSQKSYNETTVLRGLKRSSTYLENIRKYENDKEKELLNNGVKICQESA